MTVRESSDTSVQAAGAEGSPLTPREPAGGWAVLPPAPVDVEPAAAVEPVAVADVDTPPAYRVVVPTEGDDLVGLLVALNRTGPAVYFDARPEAMAATSAA
ncbi:hypothetical protein [Streptomyces sp. NPDC001297]|uniref:hypothetical protein n=1 Tax=Streptomyces sp. NPDC001297 TaxID=3364559 RepID=UPI00368358FB